MAKQIRKSYKITFFYDLTGLINNSPWYGCFRHIYLRTAVAILSSASGEAALPIAHRIVSFKTL